MLLFNVLLGSAFMPCIIGTNMLSQSNTELSLDLLKQLYDGNANLFYSPASISTAMAMTMAGTNGDTTKEMLNALYGGLGEQAVHQGHQDLMKMIKSTSKVYDISMANRLYGKQGFKINPVYIQLLKQIYNATFLQRNLASEATRLEINQWVEKVTKDKIKNLIPPGALTPRTVLVIVNAIYFKANWMKPFQVSNTRLGSFYVKSGTMVKAPMMRQTTRALYYQDSRFQMLGLPYENYTMTMVMMLPREKYGLENMMKSLTAPYLVNLIKKMPIENDIEVVIPKFEVEADFVLNNALKRIGVKKLFKGGDFSRMADPDVPLKVSDVIHKAFIKVDEKGTEAAAATGVMIMAMSARIEPLIFRADHPFIFFIWHNQANMPLFSGVLVNPSKKSS